MTAVCQHVLNHELAPNTKRRDQFNHGKENNKENHAHATRPTNATNRKPERESNPLAQRLVLLKKLWINTTLHTFCFENETAIRGMTLAWWHHSGPTRSAESKTQRINRTVVAASSRVCKIISIYIQYNLTHTHMYTFKTRYRIPTNERWRFLNLKLEFKLAFAKGSLNDGSCFEIVWLSWASQNPKIGIGLNDWLITATNNYKIMMKIKNHRMTFGPQTPMVWQIKE